MSVTIVEFQTLSTERLDFAPLASRVIRARSATFQITGELKPPVLQKLRPDEPLWADELRVLKIADKVLEKYPTAGEYLWSLVQTKDLFNQQIFVPSGPESAEILLELQQNPQSPFFNQPVVALTPGCVSAVTGLCFSQQTTIDQMLQSFIDEQLFERSDVDLMEGANVVNLTELLEPPAFIQLPATINQEDPKQEQSIEKTFDLIKALYKQFKTQFVDFVFNLTDIQLDLFEQPVQLQPEAIRIDATQFLSLKALEQIGFYYRDIFDVRHVAPNTTVVKFYSKQPTSEKLPAFVEAYATHKPLKGAGQDIFLTVKPQLIDKMPPNPTYVLIKNLPKRLQTAEFFSAVINTTYRFSTSSKRGQERQSFFKVRQVRQKYQAATMKESLCAKPSDLIDYAVLFPQLDHEAVKRTAGALADLLADNEWGLVSESQVVYWNGVRPQAARAQLYDEPPLSAKSLAAPSMKQPEPEPKLQPVPKYSARQQRQQACALQISGLPSDVKIKDVAGFCKQQRIADHMAWNLHQPFGCALGPIKMCGNGATLVFNNREGAVRSEQILQQALFKTQRINVQYVSEEQYLDACYAPKDPPFYPIYCVILKQIRLPPTDMQFADLLVDWRIQGFAAQRVYQDCAVVYFKDAVAAEACFEDLREMFVGHPNDVFRVDYD